jgi:hypothetical protein
MHKIVVFLSLLFISNSLLSQELNCEVVVNADKIIGGNMQVFKTLESSINEFVNQTQWSDKVLKPQEKIDCSIVITIQQQSGSNSFSGSIQVQSSRPVYNSVYATPLFNYKDDNLNFTYTEFEPLRFDANTYESELVSTLTYYIYLLLAIDADSYALYGGNDYYNICQRIVDQVENSNSKKAWRSNSNKINRYHLLNKIVDPLYKEYRRTLYQYHINGLDRMAEDKDAAKNVILNSIIDLKKIYSNSLSSYIFRVFMDAKSDEIVEIFSDGPHVDTSNLINVLNRISPTNANKWVKIKN